MKKAQVPPAFVGVLLALALSITALLMVPALDSPLLSDDYSLLVEARTLPPGQGFDHLYRPLRNRFLLFLSAHWPVENPYPYRLLTAGLNVLLLFLFALLLWRVERSFLAAWLGLLLLGFSPLLHETLYWFSVLQDLVALVLGLACVHFFFSFRQSGKGFWLVWSAVMLAMGLGFKESAVVTLPLLVLLDLRRSWILGEPLFRWRPYIAFCLVIGLYLLLMYADQRLDPGPDSLQRGNHGLRSFAGIASNLLRSLLILFWPWQGLALLREMPSLLSVAGPFILGGTLISLFSAQRWLASAALGMGILAALAPTVAFAPGVGRRYLMAAALALLWAWACTLALHWRASTAFRSLCAALLILYAVSGFDHLREARQRWRTSGEMVDQASRQLATILARYPNPNQVLAIRIPSRLYTPVHHVPLLNNGLRGLMMTHGLDPAVPVVENFYYPETNHNFLWAPISQCPAAPVKAGQPLVLFFDDTLPRALDPACAIPIIEEHRRARPAEFLQRN